MRQYNNVAIGLLTRRTDTLRTVKLSFNLRGGDEIGVSARITAGRDACANICIGRRSLLARSRARSRSSATAEVPEILLRVRQTRG